MNLKTTIATAVAALTVAACGDDAAAEQLRDDASRTLDSLNEWSSEQWETFMSTSRDRMSELQSDFDDLKRAAAEKGTELDAAVGDAVNQASEQVEKLGDAGKDAWRDASDATERALDDASERLSKAWEAVRGG